jgi:16S rRNA (uracil1498-N3)-methyltransferase
MRLTRVFVTAALEPGAVVELPPETALHLAKVLRARSGDEITLFSGDGLEYAGEIVSVRGSKVTAAVGQGTAVDRESPFAVTLVQCLPRGDRMDLIVQKSTELGVSRIVPVFSRRSVVRLDGPQADAKTIHWRAVAVNACEQSGRNRLPRIDRPVALLDYLGGAPPAAGRLVLEPGPGGAAVPADIRAAAEIAIGPEGGFETAELDTLQTAGFVRVSLGPRILRAETAAIAALTWLQTRFGDLSAGRD